MAGRVCILAFSLTQLAAWSQEFSVHVYRRGPSVGQDLVLRCEIFEDQVEVYDPKTGEKTATHTYRVHAPIYEDAQVIWPKDPTDDYRQRLSMAYMGQSGRWIFLGVRDTARTGRWSRFDVQRERDELYRIARAIAAVDPNDSAAGTLRRQAIGSEWVSRLAAMPDEDLAEAVLTLSQVPGLKIAENYVVLRSFGWALYVQGDVQSIHRARPFYLKAIEIYPEFSSAFFNLALVAIQEKQADEAIRCLLAGYARDGDAKFAAKLRETLAAFNETPLLSAKDMARLSSLADGLKDKSGVEAIYQHFPKLRWTTP